MQRGDAEIKAEIERILTASSLVDEKEVTIAVQGATVRLTGEVDSAIEKRRARQMAEEVEGVEYVHDDLKIKGWVKVPDDELAEVVRHRLLRDAYVEGEGARIEVRANGGEIQLDGSVPDYHTKKAAEDVTWWTPGVIGVENMLLVTDEEFVDVSPLEVADS
jgi:osmotically-inducible protein OsmY